MTLGPMVTNRPRESLHRRISARNHREGDPSRRTAILGWLFARAFRLDLHLPLQQQHCLGRLIPCSSSSSRRARRIEDSRSSGGEARQPGHPGPEPLRQQR